MRLTATISCYEQLDPAHRQVPNAHGTTASRELKLRACRGDRTRTCDPWSPRLARRGPRAREAGRTGEWHEANPHAQDAADSVE